MFNHMWPRIMAGIFIPVGNHYFGEHTAVCGSSVLQAVARPRHRQSVCIHNIHVAATCRPSVLGSATMRGHMWLNKVASVWTANAIGESLAIALTFIRPAHCLSRTALHGKQ